MKSFWNAVLFAVVVTAAGCSETAQDEPKAADSSAPAKKIGGDCGHLGGKGRFSEVRLESDSPPAEILCMQEALAAGVPAEVTITMMGTDSGPYDQTYRLDRNRHVAFRNAPSADARGTFGEKPYSRACVKPTWLPGAVCPPPPPPKSRPAPFTVAPGQQVTATTRYVDVLVHPTHCTDGRTGTALEPTVDRTYGQIQVLFRVSNRPNNAGSCGDVAPIRYRVDLRAPLGDRWIVDASCIMPSVYWRNICQDTKIRARAN